MLKRTLPAPHGRAFRIRKRRSHVFLVVEPKNSVNNDSSKKVKKNTEKKETKKVSVKKSVKENKN